MAEAFCISAASNCVGTLMVKPVDYLLKLVGRPLCYLFRLEKIVVELQKQKENLTEVQTRVRADVKEAKKDIQTREIEQNVVDWLTNAEKDLKEAQSLQERIKENKRCFRWCPNWSWRYELSKKIEQKTLAIKELVGSSKFERVGHRAALPSIEFLSSKDLIASKSSTSAFSHIMEALKSDEVNIIGVWGMGGVGKTTLVKEVGYKVEVFQLFHKVVIVTVSQTHDIGNIQNKIADFIGLNFETKTKEGRAAELWARLQMEKKVLIILDDMWDELKLEEIGIPVGEKQKGCTIILTTRRKQVCADMKSQVEVSLGVMDEYEAWTLLKMNADLENASLDIVDVAKEVAKECGRLPIAIVTLARALRGKDFNAWKFARSKLERSKLMDIENVPKEVQKNAYLSLEMSYNQLRRETTKKCFLLCALYPEDYSIDVEDLVRHAWALSLYEAAESIKDVRSEVFDAITNLKDSCLLSEDDDEKRYVKVHDVVRDVARWIASNQNNGLLTKAGVDSKNESSKQKLQILLREYDYDSKTPMEDFEGMPELKVLSLRTKRVWDDYGVFSFNAIKSLKNLRSLHLEGFNQLEGISALAKLTNLEILCLHGSKFPESMESLGELKYLKVLDIRRCKFLLGFPPNLIRRLVEVEELYLLPAKGPSIKTSVLDVTRAVILSELKFLPKLASLFLKVPSLHFPKDFGFPKLERYNILINSGAHEIDPKDISTRLLKIAEGLPLNVISELLWNVESLVVSSIMEKEIKCLTDTTPGNVPVAAILQNLKSVAIEGCPNLQVIFSMKNAENHPLLLSKLKDLSLRGLPNLEYIWTMPTQHISLRSLEAMQIRGCGKLKSLFSFSLARSLECLERLEIDSCGELEQIVEQSEGDEQEISSNMSPDKSLCFPKLRNLEILRCDSLEYIFPNFMMHHGLPRLQNLQIKYLFQLRRIFRSANEREENEIRQHQLQLFPSLTELELWGIPVSELREGLFVNTKTLHLGDIRGHSLIPEIDGEGLNELTSLELHMCKSLEYLVDMTKEHVPNSAFSNLVQLSLSEMDGLKMLCNGQFPKGFLQNLKKLSVEESGQLQAVFQIDDQNQAQLQLLSNIEHLELKSLPELRWILKGPAHYISLRSLKAVTVCRCKMLKSVFSTSLIQSLRQLEDLWIIGCDELSTLFTEQESDGETESNSHLHPPCLPRLRTLSISECPRLEYVLPITLAQGLPQLEKLDVACCHELKTVFTEQESDGETESNSHLHPLCLPRLTTLKISECPRLEYVLPITLAQGLPQLEKLKVARCNELRTLFTEQESDGETESNSHLHPLCLPRLRTVSVFGCPRLEYVLPITLAQGLPQLEKLKVARCNELRTLFTEQESGGETESNSHLHPLCLPRLTTLKISECPRLEYVLPITLAQGLPQLEKLKVARCNELRTLFTEQESGGETESNSHLHPLCLPRLTTLKISECPRLEYVLPITLAQGLPQLEKLKVARCNELRTLFTEQESDGETESNSHLHPLGLPRLKTLVINSCPRLEYVLPITLVQGLPQLEKLEVGYCHELQTVFTEQESDGETESNSHLHPLCLPRLRTVRVFGCPRLEYVLPITLAQGLSQLEELDIVHSYEWYKESKSSQLKQVFGVAKQHDGVERWINLPRLKLLGFSRLTNLSSFGPENYFFKAPALERLSVSECPQLMKFTIQQQVNGRVHLRGVRLSTFKEFLRNANNLSLERIMDLQKNLIPDVDVDLQGLTSLWLEDCEDLECLANTADEEHVPTSEVFPNLVQLRMKNMIGLKVLWNGQPPRGFLQNLKSLTVERCEKLEEIFGIDELLCNTEQNQPPLLSNLDSLHLTSMSELRWIVKGPTQYVSLRSLRNVSIEKCNKLESLFSSSLIPSLSLLEHLRIDQCDELKTVFTEDEIESNTLCMPSLKSLRITNCPTLKYVAPAIYFIKAPASKELQVTGCPQLSNFSIQQDELLQYSKHFEECIDDASSCNSHLREGSPNMINGKITSRIKYVRLKNLIGRRYIWKGPIQVVLTNLEDLYVYNCKKLTYIFPAMFAGKLPNLRFLKIRKCENLEQIIVNDATCASSSQGHDEDETGLKYEKETLVFPKLKALHLIELPSLLSFSHVGSHLVFPSLKSLKIEDCSRMITSFTVDSTFVVHAETKASPLDDASTSRGDICWLRDGDEKETLMFLRQMKRKFDD